MNLNIDYEILDAQRRLIAEFIHDHTRRASKADMPLLEGIWELLSQLAEQKKP